MTYVFTYMATRHSNAKSGAKIQYLILTALSFVQKVIDIHVYRTVFVFFNIIFGIYKNETRHIDLRKVVFCNSICRVLEGEMPSFEMQKVTC